MVRAEKTSEPKMVDKINLIKLIALAVIVLAWPVYALNEPSRMDAAEESVRQQALEDGSRIYIESCAQCHGTAGEGLGSMPALDNPGLADADKKILFNTIAGAAHGKTMAAWHVDEGGILNDFQVEELVTLIQFADWNQVEQLALANSEIIPLVPSFETSVAYLEGEAEDDPHTCFACHEDPEVHLDRFGVKCARCHNTIAWAPAQLTKHTFRLDHGGQGSVTCETCHVANYYENTCYGCHDHQPDQMEQVHAQEEIFAYETCTDCHPTGREGEARKMMGKLAGQSSSQSIDQTAAHDLQGSQ